MSWTMQTWGDEQKEGIVRIGMSPQIGDLPWWFQTLVRDGSSGDVFGMGWLPLVTVGYR